MEKTIIKNNPLAYYRRNSTTQWGEDGIISEIFKRIGISEKLCIEFGAWDGKHYSNTWSLWHEENWSALLIEGDEKKCAELKKTTAEFKKVIPYCAYVMPKGENSLDSIIKKTFPNITVDLLSIDIDGDDYYIFESLEISPRVVIIEHNPTIPPGNIVIQDKGQYFGASAQAIINLGHKKNYALVALTETNVLFVHKSEFSKLQIDEPVLSDIFIDTNLTYIMTAYDGTPVLSRLPTYNNMELNTEREIRFQENSFITVNIKKYHNFGIIVRKIKTLLGRVWVKLFRKKKVDTQAERVMPWRAANGDQTLRLNYPILTQESIVVDAGGYEGQWASDIFGKYTCNVFIFEPVPSYFSAIQSRFENNKKITVYNTGLSNKNVETTLTLLDDSSSAFKIGERKEVVKMVDASTFFEGHNIDDIDLIKINIEGGEYDLLENLIESGYTKKIKNIQVQFHDFIPDAENRMKALQDKLAQTHHLTYNFPFVWENWEINSK